MRQTQLLKIVLGIIPVALLIIITLILFFFYLKKTAKDDDRHSDVEKTEHKNNKTETEIEETEIETETQGLFTFSGGEDLTICDILEAPGEVIGKSSYGTLYKALLQVSNTVRVLRFLRPVCTEKVKEFDEVIEFLGEIRNQNLVPLLGYYAGSRGEKLLVYPFYSRGNLAQLIQDGKGQTQKWSIICRISIGIAKGLHHLHTELHNPIVHGNLKSKNILLDRNYHSYISDYGLHFLMNPTAAQEMLESLESEGYKAPELIKMKEATAQTDVYSFGVILLELLTGREAVNQNPMPGEEFYLPNFMQNSVLDHRISELYNPNILFSNGGDSENSVTEERVLKLFQLAMACCSPSPYLRPTIKQVLKKLEETRK